MRRSRNARNVQRLSARRQRGAEKTRRRTWQVRQPASAISQQSPQRCIGTAERVNAGTNGFVASRASGATKTDAPIMSTPGSIAVITREEMDVRRAQSIRDLLRYAPGIYFSNDTDFRFQQR